MPNNPFDQFDNQSPVSAQSNPFNQFDQPQQPQNKIVGSGGQPTSQGTTWDMIDIMNRNFANIANGGLQMGAQALQSLGVDTSGFQQNIAQQQAMHERDYQAAMKNSPIAGTIMDVGSQIGAAVATPGTQPLMASMATGDVAGNILKAAGSSFLTGTEEYQPGGTISDHLAHGVKTGLIGGAFQGAGEAVVSGIKHGAKALFNRPVQEAANLADDGLITTMGNATQNPVLQGTENALGRVPVLGAKRGINKQVGALQQQTSNVLDDIGVGASSKVDLGTELNNAIKSSYKTATANTDKAYAEALDIASKNKISIPLQNAQSVAQQALGQVDNLKSAGISSADISNTKVGKLLQDIADLPNGQIPAKSFDALRKKIANTKIIDDTEGLSPILKQVKSALDSDLDAAAVSNSNFENALLKARNIYMKEKAPFKNIDVLDKAVKGGLDADELLNTIVKNDRPILTDSIMKALSPEGKQSFTKAIVNKVANNSMVKDGGFDLDKFSTGIFKLGETIDSLPQAEQMKIKGLQKLLVQSDNLIKTNKISPNSLGNWLGGTGAIAGAGALLGMGGIAQAVGGAAFTKSLSWALTSPKMTKLLIKLAGGKMAQTAQEGIVKSALKLLIRKGSIPAASQAISNHMNTSSNNPRDAVGALGILG